MRPFLVEDAEDFGVTPAVPDQRGMPVPALVGHTELAQHPGRCNVARIAGRIDPVQSPQPKPRAQKFRADGGAHASTPHPGMHEIGDLALAVGQTTNVQLADTDELTVGAGRTTNLACGDCTRASTAPSTKSRVCPSVFGPRSW